MQRRILFFALVAVFCLSGLILAGNARSTQVIKQQEAKQKQAEKSTGAGTIKAAKKTKLLKSKGNGGKNINKDKTGKTGKQDKLLKSNKNRVKTDEKSKKTGKNHLKIVAKKKKKNQVETKSRCTSAKQSAAKTVRSESKHKATTLKKVDITLEKLFPEKSFFGPSASKTSFSVDGKYGAYLYRPYRERRHGNDLWLYDTAKSKTHRITSVSVMARYQMNTRKVREDRIKKARTGNPKKQPKEQNKNNLFTRLLSDLVKTMDVFSEQKAKERGDWVSDADADDKSAPRYNGVTSYVWSPKADELLFLSEGDIYLYKIADNSIKRLTVTVDHERNLAWLPDGSGYIFMRGNDLMCVCLETNRQEQLYAKLPDGERMSEYRISPDGKWLVFLAVKEGPIPAGREKKVNIAQYRDRFMKVKKVYREVSDDPLQSRDVIVYLLRINNPMMEDSQLTEIYRRSLKLPRDYVKLPEWSPDSSRVVFTAYNQKSELVDIYEAVCAPEQKQTADIIKPETPAGKKELQEKIQKESKGAKLAVTPTKVKPAKTFKPQKARLVHEFLHRGGPTTPGMIHPYYLADNRRIVYMSEQTGFRQLQILDPLYESNVPLTEGHFEIYPQQISRNHRWMFVLATKEYPARREVYKVSLKDGKMHLLSKLAGDYNTVSVSQDGNKVLANYVCFGKLKELYFIDAGSGRQVALTNSHPPIAHEMTRARPEFFSYKNRHGQDIYGFMFKPDDMQKDDKRPLLIYVYGGPLGTRKMVVDGAYQRSAYFFAYYMTVKHGYITCTIDPRGNSGYGGLFEKSNYEQVGKPQVEDLVDGVHYFLQNYPVDPKRVAIHGWSFGGFQTQMCLYTQPDVFAAGMAGAGPTEWENYNAWYTSGTIEISKPGTAQLKKFSLLPLAKNLKAKLLLVHGMEDDNVLYQDTIRVYRALIKAGKETLVELFLDPTGKHGLRGDVKDLNLFRKYEEFLLRTVGSGNPKAEANKS